MPGEFPNLIDLGDGDELITVAILTADLFDAMKVRTDTVRFAGAPPIRSEVEDVDSDGDNDLVLYFVTEETTISLGDSEACLQGETVSGASFHGCDSVSPIPDDDDEFEIQDLLTLIPIALFLPTTLCWAWIRIRRR